MKPQMRRSTSTEVEASQASRPHSQESRGDTSSRPRENVVELEFVGSLQRMTAERQVALPLEAETILSELLATLERIYGVGLSGASSAQSDRFRGPPCLVLVNGREVSALNGAQTRVKPGDKVVFIPVSHGG